MTKEDVGKYMQYASYGVGAIGVILLIAIAWKVLVLLVVGAGLYFGGQALQTN